MKKKIVGDKAIHCHVHQMMLSVKIVISACNGELGFPKAKFQLSCALSTSLVGRSLVPAVSRLAVNTSTVPPIQVQQLVLKTRSVGLSSLLLESTIWSLSRAKWRQLKVVAVGTHTAPAVVQNIAWYHLYCSRYHCTDCTRKVLYPISSSMPYFLNRSKFPANENSAELSARRDSCMFWINI